MEPLGRFTRTGPGSMEPLDRFTQTGFGSGPRFLSPVQAVFFRRFHDSAVHAGSEPVANGSGSVPGNPLYGHPCLYILAYPLTR